MGFSGAVCGMQLFLRYCFINNTQTMIFTLMDMDLLEACSETKIIYKLNL